MSTLLNEKKRSVNPNRSPIFLILQAEELESRGCGSFDYDNDRDYVDYYRDQYGNIQGFIDEVNVTADSVSWGEDRWEDQYTNIGQNFDQYPDYSSGSGGGNTNEQDANQINVNRGRDFVESVAGGEVNVAVTSEVASFLSLTTTITSLVPTVADIVKQDIGLLGEIGKWTGRLNMAYSAYSVAIGLTDGEISWKDIVNAGSFIFSVGSIFVPALGLVSIGLSVAATAVPGDQGTGQNIHGSGGQY